MATGGLLSDVLQWGNKFTTGYGYSLSFSLGANANIGVVFRETGASGDTTAYKANNTANSWQTVQQYLQCVPGDLAAYTAVNGNWASAATGTNAGTMPATLQSGYGVSLFAGHSSGPTVSAAKINRSASEDIQIADIWAIRDDDGSLYGEMSAIAAEHAIYWREFLRALDQS